MKTRERKEDAAPEYEKVRNVISSTHIAELQLPEKISVTLFWWTNAPKHQSRISHFDDSL